MRIFGKVYGYTCRFDVINLKTVYPFLFLGVLYSSDLPD
uniref:Uncharacterized protein n=1 Tax=Arundo donax TaxID=35708 RepID=A0A0A9EGB2_ARUDO